MSAFPDQLPPGEISSRPTTRTLRKMLRAAFVMPIIALAFLLYFFSQLSIFLWGPPFKAIINFFYFSYYLFPRDAYVLSGALPIPNYPLYILVLVLSFVFAYLVGLCGVYVANRYSVRFWKLLIIFFLALFILGGSTEYATCLIKLSNTRPSGEKTLTGTGLLNVVFNHANQSISPTALQWFSTLNGLTHLQGDPNVGRALFSVRPGSEAGRLCRIRSYQQVADATGGITESFLFAPFNKEFWLYIDQNFCDSGQLVNHTAEECVRKLRRVVSPEKSTFSETPTGFRAIYRAGPIAFTYDPSQYIVEERGTKEEPNLAIFAKRDSESRVYVVVSQVISELPIVTVAEQTWEARQRGDTNINALMTKLEKKAIGAHEFICWEELEGNFYRGNCEAVLSDNIHIAINYALGTAHAQDSQIILDGLTFVK